MRPHISKTYYWHTPLTVTEKKHLFSHGIKTREQLEDDLKWQRKWTTPCKECEEILTKLEETQK